MQDAKVGCAGSRTTTAADVRQADLEIGMFWGDDNMPPARDGPGPRPAAGCLPEREPASGKAGMGESQGVWRRLSSRLEASLYTPCRRETTSTIHCHRNPCWNNSFLLLAILCCILLHIPTKPLPACVSNPRHRPPFSYHAWQRLTSGHLHFPPPIGASARHTNLRHLTATDDNLRPPATTHIQPWTPCATSPHHCLALAAATSSLTSCCPTSRPLPSLSQISTRLPPPRMLAREKQATKMPWTTYWLSWTRRTWA